MEGEKEEVGRVAWINKKKEKIGTTTLLLENKIGFPITGYLLAQVAR